MPLRRLEAWDGLPRRPSMLLCLCGFVVVCCLLLGGGTRNGFLADTILQLIALPLLLIALWQIGDMSFAKPTRRALWFCLTAALLPLLQLISLPPKIWTALPNREPSVAAFELLGSSVPWMPISVSPHATWLAALSLLPALALFLGTVLLDYRERRLLSLVIVAIGILSAFVGLLQVAQGPESPLRFFEVTNRSEAVGFFANRNHFAAFLYVIMVFAAAWAIDTAIMAGAAPHRKIFETASVAAIATSFTILVAIMVAQTMTRSRAGLGLTIVALFGVFALALPERRTTSMSTAAKLLTGATLMAVMFAAQYALYPLLERFTSDPLADARIAFARNTIEAARAYMPFGAGIGTFVPVYGLFEKPADTLINAYANHAHNDVLEFWLETGVMGIVLMGGFFLWLVLRSVTVWRPAPDGSCEIDVYLSRGATIILWLLIAHSFVDYPLRTEAMMVITAFACALLVEPPVGPERERTVDSQALREMSRKRQEKQAALSGNQPRRRRPAQPLLVQNSDIGRSGLSKLLADESNEWPEEWRKPSK